MRKSIIILSFFLTNQIFGQTSVFYKTVRKKNFHYIEFKTDKVLVYKMGWYIDKAGSGPAITLTDTLFKNEQLNYQGKIYSLKQVENKFTLQSDKLKPLQVEQETNFEKVNTELNNAYCLKSYFDLSDKLNNEFPLNHYTFRNGYYAWRDRTDKSVNHTKFIEQTDKTIKQIYDSTSLKQTTYIRTTNFILNNLAQVSYSTLIDSIKTLPIDWKPQSGYFDKVVYQMTKSKPEYFYKLLQDFPSSKTLIYYAINHDKDIVKQLKQVQGYDNLKKEFFKDYKFGKTMGIKTIATYAVFGGLLTWLIIAQP